MATGVGGFFLGLIVFALSLATVLALVGLILYLANVPPFEHDGHSKVSAAPVSFCSRLNALNGELTRSGAGTGTPKLSDLQAVIRGLDQIDPSAPTDIRPTADDYARTLHQLASLVERVDNGTFLGMNAQTEVVGKLQEYKADLHTLNKWVASDC
jgi:hypothetical protein